MFVHISSGFIPLMHVNRFLEHVTNQVAPRFRSTGEVISVYRWQHRLASYEEITAVSVWHSREAMDFFLGGIGDIWEYERFSAVSSVARVYTISVL
jgi:hypothetical protein